MLAEPISAARSARVAGLYAVTPDERDTAVLVAKIVAAVDGGATIVQYRNKTLDPRTRRAQAQALASTKAIRRALFIVNDDAILARDLDADGVHLGEDDGDVAKARACIGRDRIIGVSCYDDVDRAHAAVAAGADYVAFGSFFTSTIKPGARRASVDLLAQARALGVRVVAIGGITAANASALIDAGADAVAVISDVFAHDDPAEVQRAAAAIARQFRR
ncbi:MAG TPA: thiamine phosphate synthase [Casimicrobiaceae bacterium]|nr:thiamine phosphate synthase [Casimicrobiaceae bacterium]